MPASPSIISFNASEESKSRQLPSLQKKTALARHEGATHSGVLTDLFFSTSCKSSDPKPLSATFQTLASEQSNPSPPTPCPSILLSRPAPPPSGDASSYTNASPLPLWPATSRGGDGFLRSNVLTPFPLWDRDREAHFASLRVLFHQRMIRVR